MNRCALLLCLVAVAAPLSAQDAAVETITEAELKEHVAFLASPELGGRRDEGGRKAAAWLVERFKEAGLKPLPGKAGWLQEVPGKDGGAALGTNVVGFLPGSDEKLAREHVILSAHFDHLGKRGEDLYPGADDNASGVAALLEAIEAFQKGGPAKRTLCFVAFDLEERGLIGSQHFADHPPFPLEDLALFITCDMLGRSLGDIVNDAVFVLGTEHAPELRALVEGQETETEGRLKAGFLGTDLIGTRSDYGPFRARGVPYLFFSTGEHRDYHKPTDVPDRIEYGKLTKIARLLYRVTRAAADAPERPVFVKQPEPDLREVKLVSRILGTVAAHSGKLGLSETDHAALTELRGRVDAIVASGKVTAAQRQSLKEAAQLLLFRLIR
jgi:hypothetical protein